MVTLAAISNEKSVTGSYPLDGRGESYWATFPLPIYDTPMALAGVVNFSVPVIAWEESFTV